MSNNVKLISYVALSLFVVSCSSGHKNTDQATSNTSQQTTQQGNQQANVSSIKSNVSIFAPKVFFDFDSYKINENEKASINDQVKYINEKNCNASVVIEGHADKRGTVEYNIVLGKNRANAVAQYIKSHLDQKQCKCPTGKGKCKFDIRTTSFGKGKPAVEGDDEYSFAQNRRTETKITLK